MLGVPERIMRDPKAVAALRNQRAQAKARQEQMMALKMAAEGAKDLGQARMGKGTALDAASEAVAQ
jgi:hypothetical protein